MKILIPVIHLNEQRHHQMKFQLLFHEITNGQQLFGYRGSYSTVKLLWRGPISAFFERCSGTTFARDMPFIYLFFKFLTTPAPSLFLGMNECLAIFFESSR